MQTGHFLAALTVTGVLAGCQTTPDATSPSGAPKPFERTGQPVPETPQFKDGRAVAGQVAQEDAATREQDPLKRKHVSPNMPGKMNVVAVVVDAKDADKGIGAAFKLKKAQAGKIADQVITANLEARDNDSGVPVVVNIDLEMLFLPHGAYVAMGSTNSASRATMSVLGLNNSEILLSGVKVSAAGSRRLPGVIGATQIEGQEREMERVAAALAEKIAKAMFGG